MILLTKKVSTDARFFLFVQFVIIVVAFVVRSIQSNYTARIKLLAVLKSVFETCCGSCKNFTFVQQYSNVTELLETSIILNLISCTRYLEKRMQKRS